jgi:hypothetical protein
MNRIRFSTDEDIYGTVALRLRPGGYDAISTPEAGRLGEDDPSQLAWATREGRVLITFNVADFARQHQEWIVRGDIHTGIVVSHQRPIGEMIRRLLNLGQSLSSDEMLERLEYLSNWPPL